MRTDSVWQSKGGSEGNAARTPRSQDEHGALEKAKPKTDSSSRWLVGMTICGLLRVRRYGMNLLARGKRRPTESNSRSLTPSRKGDGMGSGWQVWEVRGDGRTLGRDGVPRCRAARDGRSPSCFPSCVRAGRVNKQRPTKARRINEGKSKQVPHRRSQRRRPGSGWQSKGGSEDNAARAPRSQDEHGAPEKANRKAWGDTKPNIEAKRNAWLRQAGAALLKCKCFAKNAEDGTRGEVRWSVDTTWFHYRSRMARTFCKNRKEVWLPSRFQKSLRRIPMW